MVGNKCQPFLVVEASDDSGCGVGAAPAGSAGPALLLLLLLAFFARAVRQRAFD